MNKIQISQLKSRIIIEQYNYIINQWQHNQEIWAAITDHKDHIVNIEDYQNHEGLYKIIIRAIETMTHDMRIIYKNQTLKIKSISKLPNQEFYLITAYEHNYE